MRRGRPWAARPRPPRWLRTRPVPGVPACCRAPVAQPVAEATPGNCRRPVGSAWSRSPSGHRRSVPAARSGQRCGEVRPGHPQSRHRSAARRRPRPGRTTPRPGGGAPRRGGRGECPGRVRSPPTIPRAAPATRRRPAASLRIPCAAMRIRYPDAVVRTVAGSGRAPAGWHRRNVPRRLPWWPTRRTDPAQRRQRRPSGRLPAKPPHRCRSHRNARRGFLRFLRRSRRSQAAGRRSGAGRHLRSPGPKHLSRQGNRARRRVRWIRRDLLRCPVGRHSTPADSRRRPDEERQRPEQARPLTSQGDSAPSHSTRPNPGQPEPTLWNLPPSGVKPWS